MNETCGKLGWCALPKGHDGKHKTRGDITREGAMKHTFKVQTGKGPKGSYKTRYEFKVTGLHSSQAWLYYSSINVGNGYKKRLLRDDEVLARSGVVY